MRKVHFLILLFMLVFGVAAAVSQNKHTQNSFVTHPKTTHFTKNEFQADAQFWTMTRDKEGIYYFGNNDGVLVFDGERWQKVVLPNNSSVRSLTMSDNGCIYAGGFNEIGLIQKDSIGSYFFNSLLGELELEREKLDNLWQVHDFKKFIIYRSFLELIVISGTTATRIPSTDAFLHSDVVNNKYYVQDNGNGILGIDPEKMAQTLIFEAEDYNNEEFKAFLSSSDKDEIILIAKNGNIYKGNTLSGKLELWKKIFEENQNDQLISAIKYKNRFLLGTLSSGILTLSEDGHLDKHPAAFKDVLNSSILNMHLDGENVWAILNNGLDFIEFDSPVAHIFDDASIYDIKVDSDKIYLATNKGVFYSNFNSQQQDKPFDFEKIPDLEGQVWTFFKEGNSLLIGHDKGLFLLKDGLPQKIGNIDGFWKVIPIKDSPGKYLAANYTGLYLLTREKQEWILQHKIKGFDESTRDILQTDQENTFWVCHGYKGVYKLKINNDFTRVYAVEHYTDQNGLQSPFNVNVTKWKEDIVFTTNTGIYNFNENNNYFEPYEPLNKILDKRSNTRKILKNGDVVWVVQDDEIGYFNATEDNPKINRNLFLNLKGSLNRGMESIQPLQNGKVLIGATSGLFLYDTQGSSSVKAPTKITKVSFEDGEEEKELSIVTGSKANLSSNTETIKFDFAVPGFSPSAIVQYQYFLDGIDEKWSGWEDSSFKEYTHLPAGDYNFKVRSRDLTGRKGEEASFQFFMAPVWYKTTTAYMVYLIFLALATLLAIQLVKRIIRQERLQVKEAAEKSQKLLELQIEQLQLEKDKEIIKKDKQLLEEDNLLKSKELANYTMMLVKKKDIFAETYENLQEFKKTLKTQAAKKNLQEVLVKLNQHRIGEEYMTVFDVHFEKVHKNFFKKLKSINPDLTQRELRLCAFVKMNLTNKEIAPLLNISVRGVETARYRTRKKLDVQEINFLTFLQNLVPAEKEIISP